ncbi:MAG: hypothetical protein MZV65_00635 [Chromatiales bacterium]|nr:hypothetical protein [Chromatiales bacterium]
MAQMKFDPDSGDLFVANFGEAVRSAHMLAFSLRRTAHLFPLSATLCKIWMKSLWNVCMLSGFATSLQDTLAHKRFRSLLSLEEEPVLSMLDVLTLWVSGSWFHPAS